MEIKTFSNYKQLCNVVSSNIRDLVLHNNNPVLGLATGSTPIGVYENLASMRDISFENTISKRYCCKCKK